MSALLISREDRAYHVLKLCEYAARGLVPDLEDVEDSSMPLLHGCFDALASKLQYLMPRASAQWKPEFEAALSGSHSMRIERIDCDRKTALSGAVGKCMACGRSEHNCRYAIDLAGSMQPTEWLKGPTHVSGQYSAFKRHYDAVLQPGFASSWTREMKMPDLDKGCFVVGQTCLRKAKLRYLLQTMLLEACYTCERDLEELSGEGSSDDLSSDTLYTLSNEKCADFVKNQDALELAIADEKRYVPDVPVDNEFWDIIDECRNAASGGDEKSFNVLIRKRAMETLAILRASYIKAQSKRQHDCECDDGYIGSSDDAGEEAHSGDDVVQGKRKRARGRTCVIQDDESEDDEESEEVGPATRSSKKQRQSAPASEAAASAAADGEGSSQAVPVRAHAGDDDRDANRGDGRHAWSRGRSVTNSVSQMVGRQRAAGVLPSRNDALVRLMELQARLTRGFNHADAAVCTNAIMTLQELMHRVEELSHTASI